MKSTSSLRKSPTQPDAAFVSPPKRKPGQFSIGTIVVVTAMAAFALGVFQSDGAIGLGLLALVAAAIVRTTVIEVMRMLDRRMGVSTSVASELFLSVVLVLLSALAALAVFNAVIIVAVLLADNPGPAMPDPPIGLADLGYFLGLLAALFVLWFTRNTARDI